MSTTLISLGLSLGNMICYGSPYMQMVYFAEYYCTLRDARARGGGKNVDANLPPSSNCAATMRVKTAARSAGSNIPWGLLYYG